ncbi:MAG: replicative DNA helicase [Arenicella sp.]
MNDNLTLPPQAIDAEQSLLGSLMLDSHIIDEVESEIEGRDFYRSDHQKVFNAIQTLSKRDEAIDVITVSEELEKSGKLKEIGGLAYLSSLAKNTPNSGNVVSYAKIVRENAILRRLIETSNDIIEKSYHPDGDKYDAILDYAEQRILEIKNQEGKTDDGFEKLDSLLSQSMDKIEELFETQELITGIPTGFNRLDELTTGLHGGELVVVAGRPSMGKTTFSMNIVENAVMKKGVAAAIFSLEMPSVQIATRMLSSLSRINSRKLRTGQLKQSDWNKLTGTMMMLQDKPIYVDDTPGITVMEMRSRARRLAAKHEDGLGVIVIDYLQLMQGDGNSENRVNEISAMTRGLKGLAIELDVPVIVLSQLNRGLEQRPDKRPIMSDLRESGAIEQDADLILFVYRDEVYNKDQEDNKGKAEVIIGKQRNGPIDKVMLKFLGEYTRFENFSAHDGTVPITGGE